MRIRSRLYLVLPAVLLLACGGGSQEEPAAPAAPPPSDPSTVPLVDPEAFTALVTSADGRPRVVNLWATWCAPCVVELPELVAFAKDHPEVEVILVSLDLPSLAASHVQPFAERHGLAHAEVVQLDDPDPAARVHTVLQDWPGALPYTLVLDASGEVVARFPHVIDRATLEEAVPGIAASPR